MSNKLDLLYRCVKCLGDIANAIDRLSSILDSKQTTNPINIVRFDAVVWLDVSGEYVLIHYADGTSQILHVEGRVNTISTVNRHGKTCYKLSDGREMEFDRTTETPVIRNA